MVRKLKMIYEKSCCTPLQKCFVKFLAKEGGEILYQSFFEILATVREAFGMFGNFVKKSSFISYGDPKIQNEKMGRYATQLIA